MGGGGGGETKAFCNSAATSITFPEGLLQIQEAALANWNLTKVHLPASLVSMVGNPFVGRWGNAPIETLTVAAGNAVFSLNQYGMLMQDAGTGNASLCFWLQNSMAAFISAEGVLTFPAAAGIKKIGPTAVLNDGSSTVEVKTVVFPPGLIAIAETAFAKCNSLESAILPEGLLSLGTAAFTCPITLPASLTTLGGNPAIGHVINIAAGNNSFHYDENNFLFNADATTVYAWRKTDERAVIPLALPNTLIAVADFAFAQCDIEMGVLNLPPALTYLGKGAFAYCNGLMGLNVPGGVEVVPERCFATQDYQPLLQTITLAEGVKRLEKDSFMMFGGTSILLPASLEYCDPQAFNGIPPWNLPHPLQEYHVAAGNTHLQAVEGVLYSADGTTLIHCPESKSTLEEISAGVTTIGPYAFENSKLAGYLVFPASVNTIHVSAFAPLAWNELLLQDIYMLAGPPALLPPGGAMQLTQPKLLFASTFAAQWQPLLDENGFYGPFPTEQLSGTPAFPKIARQDGVTGEMAVFFSGNLDLELTAESSDLTGLQLHYLLFEELEEAGGEPIPTAEDNFVANGGEVSIDATVRIKVAPYRSGELCGPVVQQIYRDMSEIATALNAQGNLEYITTPHAPWEIVQGDDYNNQPNQDQVVSSAGTSARPSQLQTTVTGPGCLVFWWRSNDPGNDNLFSFLDNDILVFSPSGQTKWVKMRYHVPAGQHTLTWQSIRVTENQRGNFRIDHVSWYPGENLGFIFEVEDESARVVDYLGTDMLVTVPATDGDGRPVVGLDRWAFSYNTTVRGVMLPENLNGVDIPMDAFKYCPVLNSLFFPGNPPASFPDSALWRTFYYPVDNSAAWDGYFEIMTQWGMAESYRQAWQPISYPLVSVPSITRVGGEPEENPDCFAGSVSVRLSSEAGTVVRYTTDGSIPTAESLQSPNPLQLTNTTTLTARAFREVAGVLQPCSAFSRRTLVNPVNFNQAIGVGTDTITFATDGDVPWKIYNREDAQRNPNDVIGTGPIFPGQRSTLYATFMLEEEGIFAYKQYYRDRGLPYKWQLYDQNGQPVATKETEGQLGNNWYRYTMTLDNGDPLPPGTYTMVWCLEIPLSELNYQNGEAYHSCFLDDFSVGAITVLLTMQCNPQDGGRTFADDVEGSSFNKLIGQNVTLKVEENANYIFREWQNGVRDKSRIITIKDPEVYGADANTYTAYFDEAAYIKVAAEPSEAASIHGGYRKYVLGKEVSLTVSPANGWRFLRWSDDEQLPEAEPIPANRSFICEAEHHNQTFTAIFVRCITVNGQATRPQDGNPNWWISGGGTVEGFGTHDVEDPAAPTLITLTATPESENFAFQWWDDNGNRIIEPEESTSPVRELSLIWNDVKSFYTTARFQHTAPVVIDYEPGSEGLGEITISKDGILLPLEDFSGEGCRLVPGTALTVTAIANENCRFKGWWRGYSYQQGSPLEITVSAGTNNYHAVFAQLYPVQVVLADGSPDGCSARVLLDDVDQGLNSWQEADAFLTLEAVCAPHYRARWEGNIDSNTIWRNVSATTENIFQVEFVPTYTVNLASSPVPCPGANLTFNTQVFDLGIASDFSAYGGNYWRFLRWNDGVTDSNRTLNPTESGTYSFTAFFERYGQDCMPGGIHEFQQLLRQQHF
ncbi:MAG: leucine-rich repeat protein [Lentisphaerae bacterium]|nr:leucine-rich repeat protein [Lentisphaerota bacterium]